ncbi:hypothetical protein [Methanobrevibacter sp.]|uniref:hypothetical protein n=1 Tax=Methanobrevibacter sp. TaxID=66852 RepID=UPI002E7825A1|nr:hypothetical protein [Methanobrevibacter sp.]MEE1336129.1 hypothetical protein [Methanobrevibacter sp.]
MNGLAIKLNELIDIFGFGCEFTPEEIANHFENPFEVVESLKKHELIEKNQVSGKYYLTDIFTCSSFLSQYLKEDEKESENSKSVKTYSRTIKREELCDFMAKFSGLEQNIAKIEIESDDDSFDIDIEIEDVGETFELPI